MALVNSNDVIPFETEDALDNRGYALTFGTSAGKVAKAGNTDQLVGVSFTDTKNVLGTAEANKMVGVVMYKPGVVVELLLEDDNQAISYGDDLCVTSDTNEKGKWDLMDGVNETGTVWAKALEAVSANTGGLIKALFV